MSFILTIFAIFSFIFASAEAGVRPTECQMWEDVSSRTMEQEEYLNVTCVHNGLCTGYSCTGSLLFEFAVLKGREAFGFSLEFIPCSYPLVLRIRINSSELEFMKLIGVHGRNEQEIILVTPDVEDREESFGRLNLAWNAVLKPVKYFVELEMNFTRIFMNGEFPSVTLVPRMNYPVPNCQYGPPSSSDSAAPTEPPEISGCEGSECDTRFQRPVLPKSESEIDYGLILKVSLGTGALLVALCALVGVVLVRRHRRTRKLVLVDNDLKGESEEEEIEETEDDRPSIDSPSDKRSLLKI